MNKIIPITLKRRPFLIRLFKIYKGQRQFLGPWLAFKMAWVVSK